ncbi:MAG: hypothetical protein ACI30V_03820 [Muribaculaceae bacterium]
MKSRLVLLISFALVAASMSATKQQLQQAFDRIAGSNFVRSNSMYNGSAKGKNTNLKVWKFKIPSDQRELFDNVEAAFADPGDAYFKTDSRDGSNQAFLISCGDSQKVTVGGKDKNVIVACYEDEADSNYRHVYAMDWCETDGSIDGSIVYSFSERPKSTSNSYKITDIDWQDYGFNSLSDLSKGRLKGTVIKSDGTMISSDGTVFGSDGTIVKSDGTVFGSDGTIVKSDGTVIGKKGNVFTVEDDSKDVCMQVYADKQGTLTITNVQGASLYATSGKKCKVEVKDYVIEAQKNGVVKINGKKYDARENMLNLFPEGVVVKCDKTAQPARSRCTISVDKDLQKVSLNGKELFTHAMGYEMHNIRGEPSVKAKKLVNGNIPASRSKWLSQFDFYCNAVAKSPNSHMTANAYLERIRALLGDCSMLSDYELQLVKEEIYNIVKIYDDLSASKTRVPIYLRSIVHEIKDIIDQKVQNK